MSKVTTVTIYGASDDLVEVVGECVGCDEYNTIDDPLYVEFSNGMAFKVEYTDRGVWTVEQVAVGGSRTDGTRIVKEPHGEGDDPEPHTETVKVTGPAEWVEVWRNYPPAHDDMSDKVAKEFDLYSLPTYLGSGDVREIWGVLARAKRRKVG